MGNEKKVYVDDISCMQPKLRKSSVISTREFNDTLSDEDVDYNERLVKASLEFKVTPEKIKKVICPELSAKKMCESPAYENFGDSEKDFGKDGVIDLNKGIPITGHDGVPSRDPGGVLPGTGGGTTVDEYVHLRNLIKHAYGHNSATIIPDKKPEMYEFKEWTEEELNSLKEKEGYFELSMTYENDDDLSMHEIFEIANGPEDSECYKNLISDLNEEFPKMDFTWICADLSIEWKSGILNGNKVITAINKPIVDELKQTLEKIMDDETKVYDIVKRSIIEALDF